MGHFVVFDLHSYNHRRNGTNGSPANPHENPEVNIFIGTMDRSKWGHLVDGLITDLCDFNFNNRHFDVRENIRFKGDQLSRWIHQTFPQSACSISFECKNNFMEEWSGKPNQQKLEKIRLALRSTIRGVLEELKKLITI